MLVLSALVSWIVETSADAALNWVIKKLRSDRNFKRNKQPEEISEENS